LPNCDDEGNIKDITNTVNSFWEFWKEYLGNEMDFNDLSNRQMQLVEIVQSDRGSAWIYAYLKPEESIRLAEHQRKMEDTTDELEY